MRGQAGREGVTMTGILAICSQGGGGGGKVMVGEKRLIKTLEPLARIKLRPPHMTDGIALNGPRLRRGIILGQLSSEFLACIVTIHSVGNVLAVFVRSGAVGGGGDVAGEAQVRALVGFVRV
jgi:hypothetical protein